MINHSLVPQLVQTAWPSAAPRLAKRRNMDVVSPARFPDGMQGLVQVGNEVHEEFQRLNALRSRRPTVSENGFVDVNSIDHAVVMVGQGGWMRHIRVKTISRLRKSFCTPRNVYEMPARSLRTFVADLIRPVRNGREVVVAEQIFNLALGCFAQMMFGDFRHNAVPRRSPGKRRYADA